ncbi:hypothetical protein HSACCH_00798 [Halanaerobium saccharolyticum subsp. saccharolyticum DSM 6643]|uniref:Uncharacterized protein n=1 Tax=Halanaerobium saccharolyticum subsp. saccharolyticum DSM 6643 TaxID=1293054 RepID=M5DZT2_9FIRM|nr:hypothetical protein [Halanaerobium saccharolyticum]CCU78659.1 hypothetical protein HSACCH_00798 [Halanaerobium saccharolyticum subsp. saccharolyticum DSM 6643]
MAYTYTTGLTIFNKKPGTTKEMSCNVCDSKCEVKRNVLDYKDFGSAMAKKKTRFDRFKCPHAEKEWHQNLEKLVEQKRENHSTKIDQMLQEEIEAIKAKHLA